MNISYTDFDHLEFQDVSGEYRLIRGCSLTNREELRARIQQLQKQLEKVVDGISLIECYETDKYFRHLCHRCLELCGVCPEWVDLNMMIQMLFPYYEEDGKPIPGILIQFNFPIKHEKSDKGRGGTGAKHEEIIAALWSHTEDLQKALELAATVPAEQLLGIVEARSKQMRESNPQGKEKAQQREWQNRARADMDKMRGPTS